MLGVSLTCDEKKMHVELENKEKYCSVEYAL